MSRNLAGFLLFLFGLSAPHDLFAQNPIQTVVLEGDMVSGVGAVTRIDNLAVNDNGEWIVEADTDNADTDADGVLLKMAGLYLREGQALTQPAGASLDFFDSITLNNNDDSGWNFFLDGTTGLGDDSGLYFNDTLVIQESEISTAPGFSPGTTYEGYFDVKINDSNRMLVLATMDDPNIPTSGDRALIIVEVDAVGNLVSEAVVAKEGDLLAGQTDAVTDFETAVHRLAFTNQDDVMFIAKLDSVSTADLAIYLNNTLLAQEGSASPVAGRNYEFLNSRSVTAADGGAYAFVANLDGASTDDEIMIRNGAKFVQEGDSLPDIAPFLLTGFGTGPIAIDTAGNLLWYGDWDDPNTDLDTGLFVNQTLVVQEGVSQVNGVVIDSLKGIQDGYALSPNGRYLLFEAELANGLEGAFLLELGPNFTLAEPSPGQAGVNNDLQTMGGSPGATAFFVGSIAAGTTPFTCGGNSITFDMAGPILIGNAVANGSGSAQISVFVKPGLSGQTVFLQALEGGSCLLTPLVTYTFP